MAWKSSLSKVMQELRIHMCQSSATSKGVRDFVLSSYAELKKANPDLPILVREASGAEAKLIARFDYGVEQSVSVQGLDAAGVDAKLKELAKAGASLPRSGE